MLTGLPTVPWVDQQLLIMHFKSPEEIASLTSSPYVESDVKQSGKWVLVGRTCPHMSGK